MDVVEKLLINASDAAKILGVGRSLFYEMNSSGRLGPTSVVLGSKNLWSVDELREWVRAGCPARETWQGIKDSKNE